MSEMDELLKQSPNSKSLYDLFEKHFALGDLGVFQASIIQSLKTDNPVSALVVAPSGQFKSSVGAVVNATFPKSIYGLDRFTEYGIIKHGDQHKMNDKTWYIGDFVRTLEGMSEMKTASLLTFLAVLMSDGHADVSNYQHNNARFDCRMNLIGNVAFTKYREIEHMVKSSTFYERLFVYWYLLDRKMIREKTERPSGLVRLRKFPKRFSPSVVLPVSLKPEVHRISDSLCDYGYSSLNVRCDNLVAGWVCGHAILNGRKEVIADDFQILEHMAKMHFAKMM